MKSQNAPFIINGLDDETQSRTDSVDILSHDLFDDGGLSRIVQAPDFPILVSMGSESWARSKEDHQLQPTASGFSFPYLSAWLFVKWTAC